MRIVVVGGSGLVGDKVMTAFYEAGHHAVAASPAFGIDAFTGEGLDEAMAGAEVVVDVSNAPGWGDDQVRRFFTTVSRNALKAGRRVGVRHHVVLSVVGCDRLPDSGYLRAKVAQEAVVRRAGVPFTIVRSTQYMERLAEIAGAEAGDEVVRVSPAPVQPIAARDAARLVAGVAARAPVQGVVEIAGPDTLALDDAVGQALSAQQSHRRVAGDPGAPYLGALVRGRELLPGPSAGIAPQRFADWLGRQRAEVAAGV
jgi:uncharacterized protein YbjT (DUF2867 family)